MEWNEADQIRAAASGDTRAFNLIVLAYREPAFLLANRLLRNAQDAEDIVQDAFIKAWEELPKFRGDSKFTSWLYRIIYNLSLNRIRSRSLRHFLRLGETDGDGLDDYAIDLPDDDPLPDEIVMNAERRALLEKAIAQLPAKQRAVFVMRHEQGLSNPEIAEITGKSEGSVKANFSFAVAKLKRALEE